MPTNTTTKTFNVPGCNAKATYEHTHAHDDDGYSFDVKLTVPNVGEVTATWSGPEQASRVTGMITLSCGWEFAYDNHKQELGGEEMVVLWALMHMTGPLPFTFKQMQDGAVLNAAWREVMSKAPWCKANDVVTLPPELRRWRVPGPVPRLWWTTDWHNMGDNFPVSDGGVAWAPLTHATQGVWQGFKARYGGEPGVPDNGGLRLIVYPDCALALFNGACIRGATVYEALDRVPLPFNPFPNHLPPAANEEQTP